MKNRLRLSGVFLALLITSCSMGDEEFEPTSSSVEFDVSSGLASKVSSGYSYVHDGYDSGWDGNRYYTISKYGGDADFWFTEDNNHSGRFSVDCRGCDIVAGKGWKNGWSNHVINYGIDYTYGEYDMIGVYGWTYSPELVEYYVVERGSGIGAPDNGTYLSDNDKKYKFQIGYRQNSPSIRGFNENFKQFVSQRYEGSTDGHQRINMQNHFNHWGQKGGIGALYNHDYQVFGIEIFTASNGRKKSGGMKANVW